MWQLEVFPGKFTCFFINFNTDSILVDMRGGERWQGARGDAKKEPERLFEPGELLLVDHDGSLVVRTEMADQALLPVAKPAADAASGDVTLPTPGGKKAGASDLLNLDGGDKK